LVLVVMLDPGEAAVLVLARSLGISHVLMDERKGRKIARAILGLTVSGTARLLVDAARAGLIVSARRELRDAPGLVGRGASGATDGDPEPA